MRLCLENLIQENELLYMDCSRYGWNSLRVVGNQEDNVIAYKYISENDIALNSLPTIHSTITERIMDYMLEGFNPENPSDLVRYIENKLNIKMKVDITEEPQNNFSEDLSNVEIEEEIIEPLGNDEPYEVQDLDGIIDEVVNEIVEPVDDGIKPTVNEEEIDEIIDETIKEIEETIEETVEEQTDIEKYIEKEETVVTTETLETPLEEETPETPLEEIVEEVEKEEVEETNDVKEKEEVVEVSKKETTEKESIGLVIETQASSLQRLALEKVDKSEQLADINNKLNDLTELIKSIKSDLQQPHIEPKQEECEQPKANISLDIKTTLYLNILEKLKGDVIAETLAKVIQRAINEDNEALQMFLQTFFEEI